MHKENPQEPKEKKSNFKLKIITLAAFILLAGLMTVFIMYFQKDMKSITGNKNADKTTQNDNPQNFTARGSENPKITVIEYSDIQCPYCSVFHKTMKQIINDYPDDVRWIYKHFPLDSIHPTARKAAEASECAGDQGRFWEYLDNLFDNQRNLSDSYLSTAAEKVGLDISQFENCLSSGKHKNKVNNDFIEGKKAGVTGTPGSIINGKLYKGALQYNALKKMIEN